MLCVSSYDPLLTHQSCAWLGVTASDGGSGLTSRDTCDHTWLYTSWAVTPSSHGRKRGVPNSEGRDFWDDRKYTSIRICTGKRKHTFIIHILVQILECDPSL